MTNTKQLAIAAAIVVLSAGVSLADRFVSTNGASQNGYSNWVNAATNLQAAVSVATNGETVWLSNGTFAVTGQIPVTNAIRIKGFFGREATVLAGGYPALTNRCFYITNNAAWLDSLIISNFLANDHGGAALLARGNITNCHFTCNQAGGGKHGAGIYIVGGYTFATTWTGLITDSIFSYGSNTSYGGGISMSYAAGTIRNCEFYKNYAGNGGAIFFNSFTTVVENCIIRDNTAGNGGVASASAGYPGIFRNCLMMRNVATSGGACYRGSNTYVLINCTIVSNYASSMGGGLYFTDDTSSGVQEKIVNCIVYSNRASTGGGGSYSEYVLLAPTVQTNWFFNSCVNQADIYNSQLTTNQGNIKSNPLFIDSSPANPNYRLQTNSPCLNAGSNQSWMAGAKDLDGRQRIDQWIRQVDMGAYEFLRPGTLFKIR